MRLSQFLLASFVCLCAVHPAGAQQVWEWYVDEGGTSRRYISDRPPPPNLKNVRITKRPGGSNVATGVPAAPALPNRTPGPEGKQAETAAKADLPQISQEDKELAARKKQADDEVKAQERVKDQQTAQLRQQNCERARAAQDVFASGQRLSITRPDGTREILDDAGRAAEQQRIQASLRNNCS